jgi:hypothetical protein
MSYVRADSGSLSYWVGVPLLFLTALAEVSVLPLFRVFGLQPNLVLVVLTAWIMVRGQEEVFYLIPLGGIFLGLAEGAPPGAALIALAPIVVLHELRGARLSEGQLLIALVFTVAVTVLYHLVYLVVFAIEGEGSSLVVGAVRVILLSSIFNVLILFPIYGLIWAASGDRRRAAFA